MSGFNGGGGVSVDQVTYNLGSSDTIPVGFLAQVTGVSNMTAGQVGVARMTLDRKTIQASNYQDGASITASSDFVSLLGGVVDDASTSAITEGGVGYLRMSPDRVLYVTGQTKDQVSAPNQPTLQMIGGVYRPTAVTYGPGAAVVLGFDISGYVKMAEQYAPGAEDNAVGVFKVEERFTTTRVSADAQIKGSAGFVHTVTFSASGTVTAGIITIYDSLTESGTVKWSGTIQVGTAPVTIIIDGLFPTGIYVGYDGTIANVSTSVSWR